MNSSVRRGNAEADYVPAQPEACRAPDAGKPRAHDLSDELAPGLGSTGLGSRGSRTFGVRNDIVLPSGRPSLLQWHDLYRSHALTDSVRSTSIFRLDFGATRCDFPMPPPPLPPPPTPPPFPLVEVWRVGGRSGERVKVRGKGRWEVGARRGLGQVDPIIDPIRHRCDRLARHETSATLSSPKPHGGGSL